MNTPKMGRSKLAKYQKSIEKIKDKYEPRILACFTKWAAQITELGGKAENPFDFADEEYQWSMPCTKPDGTTFSVDFTITEEKIRESEGTGIAFYMSVVEEGGRVMAVFSPYNYSPELWIPLDEPSNIEIRFEMFERADFKVNLSE